MRAQTVGPSLLAALVTLLMLAPRAVGADELKSAVSLRASFPAGARLGGETPIRLGLKLDTTSATAALREIRLSFPASLGLATSGLGAATCRRSPAELAAVMIDSSGLAGCPANAVMGTGTARAEVRLGPTATEGPFAIPELALVTMLAAPFEGEQFGLLFIANGLRPFGATLVFAGSIEPAKEPFGGTLLMRAPAVPNRFDADVALTEIAFEIGAPTIRYRRSGRQGWYRPEGVVLPPRCPRAGFPFQATITFADGNRTRVSTSAACPRLSPQQRAPSPPR